MFVEIVFTVNVFLLIIAFFAIIKQSCFIIAEQCDRTIISLIELKSGSHLPKKFFLFASIIVLQK